MAHLRFQVRKNTTDQYWSVVDIFTGWPAEFHGVFLEALDADEVDRMVDVLNVSDLAQRGQLRHLR